MAFAIFQQQMISDGSYDYDTNRPFEAGELVEVIDHIEPCGPVHWRPGIVWDATDRLFPKVLLYEEAWGGWYWKEVGSINMRRHM